MGFLLNLSLKTKDVKIFARSSVRYTTTRGNTSESMLLRPSVKKVDCSRSASCVRRTFRTISAINEALGSPLSTKVAESTFYRTHLSFQLPDDRHSQSSWSWLEAPVRFCGRNLHGARPLAHSFSLLALKAREYAAWASDDEDLLHHALHSRYLPKYDSLFAPPI